MEQAGSYNDALEKARSVMLKSINEDKFARFEKIINAGVAIDEPVGVSMRTSLMHCAAEGSVEMLERILALGADINGRDIVGRTALHYAARAGKVSNLKFLLEYEGADSDAMTNGGMTPLMMAVESGSLGVVVECLNASCNPFAENALGQTPLSLSEKFSYDESEDSIMGLIRAAIEQWTEQVPPEDRHLTLESPSQHFIDFPK